MNTDQIYHHLRARYADVANQPSGQFNYPVGRSSVEHLGYSPNILSQIPPVVAAHFVGVGNPFSLGEAQSGWNVIDVGCGAGFDAQIAAHYVGPTGHVWAVDMSPEMLAVAKSGLADAALSNITFVEGVAESLPVDDGWADLVISNGVLNLASCKSSAFAEIARVLRPGGRFRAVDLVLVKSLPEALRKDEYAWSN